eukprot:COSAG04_NODE_2592_length_3879_cov_15.585979_3_plen_161_part_00
MQPALVLENFRGDKKRSTIFNTCYLQVGRAARRAVQFPLRAVHPKRLLGAGQQAWAAGLLRQQASPPALQATLSRFLPVFSRFLRVFTGSPRRFQRAPSRTPGPRNSGTRPFRGELPPSFDTADANQRINWRCSHRSMAGAGFSRSRRTPRWATPRSALT